MSEPIAITGLGCRFPGGAGSAGGYWTLLRNGVDAITEVPADRWDLASLYDPDPDAPGKMYTRYGAFLPDIDRFDTQFFGISPREAMRMDPQQRLLLEVTWEALDDAGQPPEKLAGSTTGVFLGISTNDYAALRGDLGDIDPYTGTGTAFSVAAGRLSYLLGSNGPNIAVDTACSSSLVAVHLACQSLRSGECGRALAGGVNLILVPDTTTYLCRLRALAPDGRCKTFDAAADGYVRGDGCAMVVLKRLSDAVRDHDRILAVIRGSAINHDGRSNGLTAPNGAAQESVIRAALQNAGVEPSQVGYVEAHGTGTPLGDGIELQSLSAVFRDGRARQQKLLVGSVKTNFGHLEAAAGIAGLIKVVLALRHGEIPPHLHFKSPNAHLSWHDMPLEVRNGISPWPSGYPERIAGVSSFGISGTNAHVVLAEAPPQPSERPLAAGASCLLPLSARHPDSLQALAQAHRHNLQQESREHTLNELCYTAAVRRSHYEHRLAVLAQSEDELDARLAAFLQGESSPDMWTGVRSSTERRQLAFVFPGQGGQWPGMGRDLFQTEAAFREAIEQCDKAMRRLVDWSLIDALKKGEWDRIDIVQPAVFAIQVGLASLWHSWGIVPDAVVGHSMGEVAAAHVAGILSLDDAALIICRRSALLRRVSGHGAMLIVELSMEDAQAPLARCAEFVSVAASNSARSTVLSGDVAALEKLAAEFESDGVFCRWVKVDVASHSPQMDPLRDELLQVLDGLKPQTAVLPFYSTVSGLCEDGRNFDAAYWVRNLRQPVLFAAAVERMAAVGNGVFVEVSPHPILLPAIEDNVRGLVDSPLVLPSTRRDLPERETMLRSLGALYAAGQQVTWDRVYAAGGRPVPLPAYPWIRESFWISPATRRPSYRASAKHPFLDTHIEPADRPGTHLWQTVVSLDEFPYLGDHRLGALVVLPAAAYAEMVLEAATQVFADKPFSLESLTFHKMLILDETNPPIVQISLSEAVGGVDGAVNKMGSDPSRAAGREQEEWVNVAWKGSDPILFTAPSTPPAVSMQIAARTAPNDAWAIYASAVIRPVAEAIVEAAPPAWEMVRARCTDRLSGGDYYRALAGQGLPYGPSFTGITEVWRKRGELLAPLAPVAGVTAKAGSYCIHPAVLDMCFQAFGAALGVRSDAPYLPAQLGTLRLWRQPGRDLVVHARVDSDAAPDADAIEGDLWLFDGEGQLVLEVRRFRVQRLEPQADSRFDSWLHQSVWRHKPHPDDAASKHSGGSWLILADPSGLGPMLAERLETNGLSCVVRNPAGLDFSKLLHDLYSKDHTPCRGVVWLSNPVPPQNIVAAACDSTESVLSLVQALVRTGWRDMPRLFLVTAGCQSVSSETSPPVIVHAPLWGLGRTIAMEHPEFSCTSVDLSATVTAGELDSLREELHSTDSESQIALRGSERYVARLARYTREEPSTFVPDVDQPFRLEIDRPGVLDHLTLRAVRRRKPGPGEVEIRVAAAGLNFLDVLAAMGVRPDLPAGPVQLGGECAGTIVAVGEGVVEVKLGDEVMAIAPNCFGTIVTTRAEFVVPKPESLTLLDAATIPIAFLTAYYALQHVARLQPGERVLIHSASGGVGLAAIQIARWIGADIFATAGNPEKRDFLRSLGIAAVMDSRSLEFAQEVSQRTGGQGVDVVLNSLTGEALARSLALLAPYGRFLEIGKKDVYANNRLQLWPFHKNLSYSMIDLARMLAERPVLCARFLREVAEHFHAGNFTALPRHVFPIAWAPDAFREMAQARHTGKIVVSLEDHAGVRISASSAAPARIHSNGTYLITGGLGGLGLSVARWMVNEGARHLVLVGRSGASGATAQDVDAMRSAGADVRVVQADVADASAVDRVIAGIDRDMPPLAGVIHAAGVLEDSTLLQMDPERLRRVMAPKVAGAWNLHAATRNHALDFFVLYSSGSALLGSPGQGNYNAANAFIDALAHYRRRQGWPALAIDWGPFSDVGMVAGPEWTDRLSNRGMGSLTSADGTAALAKLLAHPTPQVAVLPLNARQWRQIYPRFAKMPFFAELDDADGTGDRKPGAGRTGDALRQELMAAGTKERLALLEQYAREQIASVLRLQADRIGARTPFQNLGMDSLMALELRNRLEDKLDIRLPATLVWQYPTVAVLAEFLADSPGLSKPTSEVETEAEPLSKGALERVTEMSDEEVDRLFAEKIAKPKS